MIESAAAPTGTQPQAPARTIVCVGGEQNPWMQGFQDYIEKQGYKAFAFPLSSSLTGAVSRLPYGVVVFDSGEDKTTAKLKRIRECTRYMDTPIIAVTVSGDRLSQSMLLAAGAHVQLPATAEHAAVLQALHMRADIQPVLSDIQAHVLDPFVAVTRMTFMEMARTNLTVRATYQKQSYKIFGEVSAVLGLFGKSDGAMVLSFPRTTAVKVTQCIFPDFAVEDDDEMVKDCVAELANIIGGQTKGRLAGTPFAFNISTPTVISGSEHVIQHKSGVPSLVAIFNGGIGEFALQVCMDF